MRQDQVAVLRAVGCDTLQGFFGADPMPESTFLAWAEGQSVGSLAQAS